MWLAEHHLYGASPLGIRSYAAGEPGLLNSTMAAYSVNLNTAVPWYSHAYGDLVEAGQKSPWNRWLQGQLRASHILGKRSCQIEDYEPHYHTTGFAHQQLPVATAEAPHKIQPYIWGFLPVWAKESESAETMNKTLNARAETIFTTPMFRGAATGHRCLVFVNGFFEWRHEKVGGKEEKIPFFIYQDGGKPFAFGGLYSDWKAKDGEVLHTCNHVTVPANHLLSHIHNSKKRMPLILPEDSWSTWLDPKADRAEVEAIVQPLGDGVLHDRQISKLITQRGADTDVKEVQEEAA